MKKTASAVWKGGLKDGKGTISTESGVLSSAQYGFKARFEEGRGTNPEELLGAAHAGCFSMALAAGLTRAGHAPTRIHTTARVHLERRGEVFDITRMELQTRARVPGIYEAEFRKQAETAEKTCPVSKALAGPEISLEVMLDRS